MAYPVTPSCMPAFNEYRVRFLPDVHAIVLVYAVTLVQAYEDAVMPHAFNRNILHTPARTQEECCQKQYDERCKTITAAYICTPFVSHAHTSSPMHTSPRKNINRNHIQIAIQALFFPSCVIISIFIKKSLKRK